VLAVFGVDDDKVRMFRFMAPVRDGVIKPGRRDDFDMRVTESLSYLRSATLGVRISLIALYMVEIHTLAATTCVTLCEVFSVTIAPKDFAHIAMSELWRMLFRYSRCEG